MTKRNYKTIGSAGGSLKLLMPSMSKWEDDDFFVIGKYLGMSQFKTKIGMADIVNLEIEEISFEQEVEDEFTPVAEGDEASLFANGSFKNNFKKLAERYGETQLLPDGTPKVINGEIVKTLPQGTVIKISRKGVYDVPKHKDCVNITIEILEEETPIDAVQTDMGI